MQNIKFPFTVTLAGDSIWGYEGPQTVTVSDISVYEDEDYKMIEVAHNTTWEIYTDSGTTCGYFFNGNGFHSACFKAYWFSG